MSRSKVIVPQDARTRRRTRGSSASKPRSPGPPRTTRRATDRPHGTSAVPAANPPRPASSGAASSRPWTAPAPPVDLAVGTSIDAVCRTDAVCDFLLWVLYRQDRFEVGPPRVPSEPITRRYGHFPQFAAARGAGDPESALALLSSYEREELARYDEPVAELRRSIAAALPVYEAFRAHWECVVKPLEEGLIDIWRDQLETCEPLTLFQRLTRLPLEYDQLHLFACYYHPSGSALTPYPYLFTAPFNRFALEPSVAWFVGHEATHLLLDRTRWWETPAGRRGLKRYGSRYAAEEPLCFLMQNRLSSICGLLPEEEMQRIDASAAPNIPLYLWMQERWDEYQESPERYPTLIQFFLDGLDRAE
jgi:hypothetical protein